LFAAIAKLTAVTQGDEHDNAEAASETGRR
jgi:hypothetical protein